MNSTTSFIKNNNIISAVEAGKKFGYTNDYVSRLAREKKIIGNQIGRFWFVDVSSFEEYLKKAEQAKKEYSEKIRKERKLERVSVGGNGGKVTASLAVVPLMSSRAQVLIKTGSVLCVSAMLGAIIFLASNEIPSGRFSSAALFNAIRSFASNILGNTKSDNFSFGASLFSWSHDTETKIKENSGESRVAESVVVVPENDPMTNEDLKKSFSDEVVVSPDQDGKSGVITPVFKDASDTPYRYLMVPVHSP